MEVRINKEVRNYQESLFFGLSLRQFLFALLAVAVAVSVYFGLRPVLGNGEIGWVCILAAFPFALGGFFQYNGMNLEQFGRVDKVIYILVWAKEKDAMRRQSVYFIILFRFMTAADKRQWSSAASIPRRKTRVKLCSRFCAANVPSHQICRSFSASRYSGLQRRSRLRRLSAVK